MGNELFSVDEVATQLGLQVRTVRGYIRDGRLSAVRIGKQYRIAREDLESFTGRRIEETPRAATRRQRHVEATSIIEIDAVDRILFDRLSTLLTASVNGPQAAEDRVRLQTVYDEERARLKIILVGGPGQLADLIAVVDAMTKEA